MSGTAGRSWKLLKILLGAGLAAWGGFAAWKIQQAQRAGAVMVDTIDTAWPENAGPRFGTRENLSTAAENLRGGRFGSVVADLGPISEPTADEKTAAQRLFAKDRELRTRFLAAVTAAEAREGKGDDVSVVRDALGHGFAAAARGDADSAVGGVELAEAALDRDDMGQSAGSGPEAVTELLRRIGPAFDLGRELMTEGHTVAEKLIARASRHYRAKEYRKAAWSLRLAGELLGVQLPAPAVAVTPKWFDQLAGESTPTETSTAKATAAVELCLAMAASAQQPKPVLTLIDRAEGHLDAGRPDEAYWWATVALNSLGMADDAVDAATEIPEQDAPAAELPQ